MKYIKSAIFFVILTFVTPAAFAADNVTIASKAYVDSIIASFASTQSDWAQTDDTKQDYIKNKPSFATSEQGDKADSAVQPAALADYVLRSERGLGNGVAGLDSDAKVPVAQLPVGTTSSDVSAGNDVRFNTISASRPAGLPPSGQYFMWFE